MRGRGGVREGGEDGCVREKVQHGSLANLPWGGEGRGGEGNGREGKGREGTGRE